MDVYSWFRRSSSRPQSTNNGEEEAIFGVTDQLIDFIKTLSLDTFNNFPLQDEEGANYGDGPGNVRKDLSEWQARHAMLVLSKVKEMSQLRFRLCPGRMKERQFWRIYFTLVKSYVAEYELRAIRLEKLRQMKTENENISDPSMHEVEMLETRSSALLEHNFDSPTHDIGTEKE
ncbi:Synapse-associated protein [Actinidia chinensis var. chinensis]|uniref:Synapse-associated protein n=1 Tax=Actinidia chinensis var. chinensis TaxID=1590841 RepID=A0A2R6PE60_ACTCC|nr:Synapse-associated protein [Actinidia chinensis var. chinensis]